MSWTFVKDQKVNVKYGEDDKLDQAIKWGNDKFGTPGLIFEIPDKLPEPSEENVRRWAGLPFKKEKK